MRISLFDISAIVWRYTAGASKNKFGELQEAEALRVYGLPCAGLREVMERTFARISQASQVVWAFDSRSQKKSLGGGYKANRKFNPDVAIQCEMLTDIAERIGIPYFKRDDYEADDFIYRIVKDNESGNYIEVLTGDYQDLSAVIRTRQISLVGIGADSNTIDMDNYSWAIRKGAIIQYNALLPFNVFFGKASNNIGVLHLPSKTSADFAYMAFLGWLQEYRINDMAIPQHLYSERVVLDTWLCDYEQNNKLCPEDLQAIRERADLIYPLEPPADCTIQPYTISDLDSKELLNVVRMFHLLDIGKLMGMSEQLRGDIEPIPSDKRYLVNMKNKFLSGTYSADNGLSLETDAFSGLLSVSAEDGLDLDNVGEF